MITTAPLIPNIPDTSTSSAYELVFADSSLGYLVTLLYEKLKDVLDVPTLPPLLTSRVYRLTRREIVKLAVLVTVCNRDYVRQIVTNILDPKVWGGS